MAVTRRGFLQSTAGAAGALAASAAGGLGGLAILQREAEASTSQRSSVHVLGLKPERPIEKLARTLSDDVFARLCQAFEGRSCKLLDENHHLGYTDRNRQTLLNVQAHTAIQLPSEFACERPPDFDLDTFRLATNFWMMGAQLSIGWRAPNRHYAPDAKDNRDEVFGSVTTMGIPFLPKAVMWAAHYVDEQTGAFMRVVAVYEINVDEIVVRWDVICG